LRALVTGASGFIGRHLVEALVRKGWEVVALSRRRAECGETPEAVHCRYVYGDILDSDFGQMAFWSDRLDAIFNLAGVNAFADPFNLYRVNVLGAVRLLEAVRVLNRPQIRVVQVGSSAEYGASAIDPIREDSALVPVTDYGISKLCAELIGLRVFRDTGQQVLFARPFNVVGPGQRGSLLQATIVEQLVAIENGSSRPVVQVGDVSAFRDFIDVRDVTAGLMAIAEFGLPGEAYNVCSGQALPVHFLVDFLIGLTGRPIEIASTGIGSCRSNVSYQRGCRQKLKQVANWEPSISMENSLKDALEFRRNDRCLAKN